MYIFNERMSVRNICIFVDFSLKLVIIQHLLFSVLRESSPAGQRVTCAKFLMSLNIMTDLIFTA